MNATLKTRRLPPKVQPTDLWTPGDEAEMEALIAACALVAQADGWVTSEERGRMLERMRRSPAVAVFGAADVLQGFEALNERFYRDPDDAVRVAENAVRRLAGRPGPSRLLVEAACAVAAADGGFDAEERTVILRLCDLVRLRPEDFDMVAARDAGP